MVRSEDRDFGTTLRLLQAAREGNREAIEDLFTRYLPRLRQTVSLRLGLGMRRLLEVDDVVQEVMLRVLRGIDRVRVESEGSFLNWLSKCVEREVVDQRRRAGRKKRGGGRVRCFSEIDSTVLNAVIFADRRPRPSELVRAQELAEKIEGALLEMPEHQRELIILRAVCGMSHAEVAAELGTADAGAVRVACFRALRRLREIVGLP